MDALTFARLTTAAPPASSFEQAEEAAPALSQRIADAWDQVVSGISWFFGNLTPAALWAIPTLALAIAFFVYFWKVSQPRKNSLEWIAMQEAQPRRLTLTLRRHPFTRKDVLPMLFVTIVYAFTAFFQLGSLSAPESYTVFDKESSYTFSYGDVVEVDKLSFFTVIGTGSYTLEYSADGETWGSLELDQSYNTLLKWRVNDLTEPADEDSEAIGPISGKIFRISAHEVDRKEGLWLGELVLWSDGSALTPVYVDDGGAPLFDEPEEWTDKATYMNSSYFDEIYHARTAFEHLNNVYPYEVSHPPLGKLILSLGILLFGMNPFGWRFMGTLVGVLMVPILYVFLKNLFGKTAVAFCGTCLFAFDFMHLVQTRIATIDSYALLFIMLMYLFMYEYMQHNLLKEKLSSTLLPLGLCGLSFALGAATKWICLYAAPGLCFLFFYTVYQRSREIKAVRNSGTDDITAGYSKKLTLTIIFCIGVFIILPACVYIASYYPYYNACGGNYGRKDIWDNQVYMLTYHGNLSGDPHPFQSSVYTWPFNIRPVFFFLGENMPENLRAVIWCMGNPLIFTGGTLCAVGLAGIKSEPKKRLTGLPFIGVAAACQLLPWILISREVYIYHFFAAVPFLILAITYFMRYICDKHGKKGRYIAIGFLIVSTLLFILFYPAITGIKMPVWYAKLLKWSPLWPVSV